MPDTSEDPADGPVQDLAQDPEVLAALAAVLALDPVTAARVRGLTPARRRRQRQTGPELDVGEGGPTRR